MASITSADVVGCGEVAPPWENDEPVEALEASSWWPPRNSLPFICAWCASLKSSLAAGDLQNKTLVSRFIHKRRQSGVSWWIYNYCLT